MSTITNEDRLALAAKLDQDLDEFINGLEKKRYSEGWPEDRWQEEMDKHPFFMKTLPKDGDRLHPMMEGLQQLKYDPTENTNEELAVTYKEDGNFYMKHKKYRMAVFSYTEGINMKCENNELNAILHNNRSAAQYFLQNYRSSIGDATKALTLNPNYTKAKIRQTNCLFNLDKYDECIDKCDELLQLNPTDKIILNLRLRANQTKANKIRDERKNVAIQRRKIDGVQKTIKILEERNIKFAHWIDTKIVDKITPDLLVPQLAPLENYAVYLDENQTLVWPAVFCYPQFVISDFQQKLSEDCVMLDVLSEMFSERIDCDKKYEYKAHTINVYFENRIAGERCKVDVNLTIRNIVQHSLFIVIGGCLTFYLVARDSLAEREYLSKSVNKRK